MGPGRWPSHSSASDSPRGLTADAKSTTRLMTCSRTSKVARPVDHHWRRGAATCRNLDDCGELGPQSLALRLKFCYRSCLRAPAPALTRTSRNRLFALRLEPRPATHLLAVLDHSPPTLRHSVEMRKGIDSTETPPLSEDERKLAKAAKKARKEARRALAATEGADDGAEDDAPVVKKRKAEAEPAVEAEAAPVEGEEKKKKKSKKSKAAELVDEAAPAESEAPVASTSTPAAAPTGPTSAAISTFLKDNRVSHEPVEACAEYPPVLSFAALPLDDSVRKGLAQYTTPTPIQSASFPVMMGGRDVIGIAETGSVQAPRLELCEIGRAHV